MHISSKRYFERSGAKTGIFMIKYTPEEIFNKLEQTFSNEGIRLVSFRLDEPSQRVYISLERFAPGLPTAFLVKGLQGTFRRYLDRQIEVILEHYEVLSETAQALSKSSKQLKQDLLKGVAPSPALAFKGTPCLDMRGASASEAASSLETFINIIKRQELKDCLFYLDNQNSRRVVRQWAAINGAHLSCLSKENGLWHLQLSNTSEEKDEEKLSKRPDLSKMERLPYKILLLGSTR